jgi:hypothetical protein
MTALLALLPVAEVAGTDNNQAVLAQTEPTPPPVTVVVTLAPDGQAQPARRPPP